MAQFSIDIEKFYSELVERGQTLKGIFCIQYPIYCIHANITDITSDPLDNLDSLIFDFLKSKPNLSSFQIASLIGTSKYFVDLRIEKLIQDKLLEKKGNTYLPTMNGSEVFSEKTQVRQHKLSYDFYLDGITLEPLPKIFYSYYRTKFISENDSYYHTNKKGVTRLIQPFGPDLVHTPPDSDQVVKNIFAINVSDREVFSIPEGLKSIHDTAFTKMSFHLLVAVSSKANDIIKEVIDGHAIYSLSDNISYYETLRRNIGIFEGPLKEKVKRMEFKIHIPFKKEDTEEEPKPILTSNWAEIDKYDDSVQRCFSFSSEDLLKVIDQNFNIKHVAPENIINEDSIIEICIDKNMILNSPDRQKLVGDLIRERDYKFGYENNNVFLLYLYYKTDDDFVKAIIGFKKILLNYQEKEITHDLLRTYHPEYSNNYRRLLIAGGEFGLLEKLDIEKHILEHI